MSLRLVRPVRLSSVLRTTSVVTFLIFSLAATSQQRPNTSQSQSAVQAPAVAKYGELPLAFEANRGQTDASVRFLARGHGYSLYLTDSEVVLALHKPSNCRLAKMRGAAKAGSCAGKTGTKPDVVRMKLAGAAVTLSAKTTGEDELPGKVNYFFGSDPAKWHTNLPTYKRVRYSGVYPGVDLVYYGNQRQLEYDFIVAPHTDPRPIQLRFSGAGKLSLTSSGDLTVTSRDGQIAFHKPQIHQETNGRRRAVQGHFILIANHAIGFAVGSYDHAEPLVIDPVLAYSTYLGGDNFDPIQGITVDSSGNAYVAGYTGSDDFPVTPGAYNVNGSGAFVAKLNATGTALIYSTFLAGTGLDSANGITVDGSGDVYVTGGTQSNFPVTPGAFQTTKKSPEGAWTGFVAKLDPTGSRLLYATYLGGSSGEGYGFIVLDGAGNAYVAGSSQSADFPVTPGAFQTVKKGNAGNAVVSVLNATGTALLYSTFIGGSGSSYGGDQAMDIRLDSSGNAYLTGYTQSSDFPVTPGAFQKTLKGGCNAFIAKINPTLSKLVYSTYLGGSGATPAGSSLQPCSGDYAYRLALDRSGNAYVVGSTTSDDFPVTEGAFQTTNKNSQGTGFVAEMNQNGSELLYSTYLGGSGDGSYGDFATSLGVDSLGEAYVTGWTSSSDFPVTPGAFQTTNGYVKAFVSKLNPTGTGLLYSTFLGGSNSVGWGPYPGDEAWAGALDESNNFYVAGQTQSTDFPVTPGAYQTTNNAAAQRGHTGFVTKLSLTETNLSPSSTTIEASAANLLAGQPLTLTAKVTPASGSGTPTGEVTFTGVGRLSPVVTLGASGEATWTSSALAPGNYSAAALYSGDEKFAASRSRAVTFTVSGSSASQIKLTVSNAEVQAGKPLTLTATVTGPSGDPTPAGRVTFAVTGSPSKVVALNGSGAATWTSSALAAGVYTASAGYGGDKSYAPSESLPVYFSVGLGPPAELVPVGSLNRSDPYGYSTSICVSVEDAKSDLLAGIGVTFVGAALTLTPPSAFTNTNGQACTATIPPARGEYLVIASVGNLASMAGFNLTVTRAPLAVTVHRDWRLYGAANPIPAITVEGLVNGDRLGGTINVVASSKATPASPVGHYPWTATLTGTSADNYTATVNGGLLAVRKAVLTVFPDSEGVTYGQTPAPPTKYFFRGFVNGDTPSVVTGAPVIISTVTSTTPVGRYDIYLHLGTLTAANYTFLPKPNVLQVYKAKLTVVANNLTMTQGSDVPTLTYMLTGFVNGDTASVVSGAPVLSTTVTSSSPPGQYPITVKRGNLSAANYAFGATVNGVLTVTP